MTEIQPGWYQAQGDPPGTQRYWDGAQWVGAPRPVDTQPMQDQQPFAAPQGFGATSGAGVPAEWVQRLVAYLIDFALVVGIFIAVAIVAGVGSAVSETLGSVLSLVGFLGAIGFSFWNVIVRQGQTGQTIGKSKQGLRLVRDDSGQPVGVGMAFVRSIVAQLLSFFTCGIGGLLDYLWPLWDQDKKRLTDKILSFSVVQS